MTGNFDHCSFCQDGHIIEQCPELFEDGYPKKLYSIEQIADYIAGWSSGSFGEVQKIGKATLLNALSQLNCDQDGIQAVTKRKNN
jgi:hypothetical protein